MIKINQTIRDSIFILICDGWLTATTAKHFDISKTSVKNIVREYGVTTRAVRIKNVQQRFWSKVNKNGNTGCWIWTGVKNSNSGYGQIRIGKKMVQSHIWAWENAHSRKKPYGYVLHHTCRRKDCVNPLCLQLMTDKMHGRLHGKESYKYSDKIIAQVRKLSKEGWKQRDIADRFGMHQSNVSRILSNKT